MVQIIPAILATTPEDYKRDIEKLNNSESFQEGWVHIDFMDNKFVPNKSIKPDVIKESPTPLKKEAHIMVENPIEWIPGLKEANFDRVIFHIESKDDPVEVIKTVKEAGIEVGIAANPETQVEKLKGLDVDVILIMGVKPGFQGRPFEGNTYERIKKTLQFFDNVAVDGAVKDNNALELVQSGAKILVSGSAIMKGDVDENLEKLWEAINQ